METKIEKVFTREEKQKILSFTLDNLGRATFKGLLIGGVSSILLRSRLLGLFIFSYTLGISLRESNDFIFENVKNNSSV